MRLSTTRFGDLEIDPDEIVTFTQPIIGFQEFRRFVLLPGPPGSSLCWLQSTDSGELAFLLMDPRQVIPDYSVPLSPHDLSELAASGAEELEVYSLVVVPEDASKIRTNLKAPIVIHRKLRLGKQMILDRSDYPIQYFLAQAKREEKKAAEGGQSCSF
jgi:flagellar assembly factor FliW